MSIFISILIIIGLSYSIIHSMWHLSKKLVIPIQICLFILLVVLLIRTFATRDNFNRLNECVEKSGIVDVEKRVINESVESTKKVFVNPMEEKISVDEAKTDIAESPAINDTVTPKSSETKHSTLQEKNEELPQKVQETPKKTIEDFTQFL